MKTKTLTALITLAASFALPGLAETAFYIDNQAAGANNGTSWADAYTNFAVAVSNVWGTGANTGATIYVRQAVDAKDYNFLASGLVLGAGFADGTPEAYNRIVGWTGEGYVERPLLVRTNYGAIIALGEVDHVSRRCYEFNNLSFKGINLYHSSSVSLYYQSSDVRFVSNVCSYASFRANDISSVPFNTNLLIQANTFDTGSACSFNYTRDVRILNNQILTKAGTSAAISMMYGNYQFLIQDNVIDSGDCISSQRAEDVIVERNRMKARYRAAIFTDGLLTGWIIRNNIFHDITGGHTSWPEGRGFISYRTSTPVIVVNNTFYNFLEEGAIAIALGADVKNAVIFNNIISGVSSGLVAVAGSTCTNDYNVLWDTVTPYSGTVVAGTHDRTADPQFKAAATYDFRLGNGTLRASAAKEFAGKTAPTNDYFGAPRGKAISFGAVQAPLDATVLLLR